jgi:alkanesulfonate monooxygenase SsuD/methylene tetrahydromethanopterin reductase-like flavin-dependent oxidoreductase (luciferase family)
MATAEQDLTRQARSPIFNANRVKLAVFGFNCDYGCTITTAEGRWELDWPATYRVAQMADAAGIEALVSLARWRGFGGVTNFNAANYETYAWAAGLAAATRHAAVFATSHVPTVHPLFAAKQAATIDHVAGGRFALNVVCGWARPELEMFGGRMMDHETAYAYAEEWLQIVCRLWTEPAEFDYDGQFFQLKRAFSLPKPLQQPRPPIMQAGSSPTGRRFAARYADMAFINARREGRDEYRHDIANLRRMAREEFGRELQVWGHGYVVCRPTEREARDYLRYYVEERGDWEAVDNLTTTMGLPQRVPPERLAAMKRDFIAGWGGYPLVGTPEQIVDELGALADLGFDGWMLSWVNYEAEVQQWIAEVLPLLEQAGLREPFRPEA